MKRKKPRARAVEEAQQVRGRLATLQEVLAVVVAQHGGSLWLSNEEISRYHAEAIEIKAEPDGIAIRAPGIEKRIEVVN